MTAWIRTRTTKAGELRYHVQYRRGGRGWPIEHAGAFKLQREAKIRRDVIGGWLAQGLNPKVELEALLQPPPKRTTFGETYDAFVTSRHDVTEATRKIYGFARVAIMEFWGEDTPLDTATVPQCREFVGWLAERYSPGTVKTYWGPFAQLFDFSDIRPNPARDRSIRKPRDVRSERVVMTLAQFRAMQAQLPDKYKLFYRVLEATGMRIGELVALTWGDVDVADSRFRVSIATAKTKSSQRWVQVPQALMDEVTAMLPLEDRQIDRRTFRDVDDNAAKAAMRRACKLAGIPNFSPHDLRHRRGSLWHHQGLPARVVSDRLGHSKTSMTHDLYTHSIADAKDDEWL
jgi:integrase